MDARRVRQTTHRLCGRRSRVVLTPRRWRQVLKKQSFLGMTVARKPDHREERGVSRNTIAQGMFWRKNSLNINVVRVLCRRLCRDPQKLLIALKNSSAGR
jgi:hypothetical protein